MANSKQDRPKFTPEQKEWINKRFRIEFGAVKAAQQEGSDIAALLEQFKRDRFNDER
jgi:hypothetical protein